MKLDLPGTSATVGAQPASLVTSIKSDQVAAYTHAGQIAAVRADAVGVIVLDSDVLATLIRGLPGAYRT